MENQEIEIELQDDTIDIDVQSDDVIYSENVIESISVNGEPQPVDENKNVNIVMPTKYSDLDNDNNTVQDASYIHTDNNYTTEEKTKLAGLENYDDTTIKGDIANIKAEQIQQNTDISQNATNISSLQSTKANKSEIPTALKDLSDDSTHRVVTDIEKTTWNNKSDFSGSYNDLSNKPTIPTKTSDLTNDSGYITNSVDNLTNYTKTSNLSSVATSGSYTDLSNKPSIPTKVSDLSNDSGFITNTVNDLTNYYKKTDTYTQAEVNSLIGAISTMDIRVVETLPTQDISTTTIYLLPRQTTETQNIYDEYIYVSNSWEQIGSTDIDLSDYYTKTETNTLLGGKQATIDSSHKLSADLVDDTSTTNKFVTSTDKTNWNAKYDKPSGGIPSTDMSSAVQTSLGKADTALQSETYTGTITSVKMNGSTIASSGEADLGTVITDISGKQDTLVSGTNIKTINNESILGSGNITVSGGNEVYIGDEQDAPASTKLLIDDDYVDFYQTPENTYSTSEQRVGTWINSKPLYRKVFTGTMANNNDFYTLIEDVDYFNIESCVAGTDLRPYEYFILSSSNCGAIDFVIVDGDLKIRARANSVFGFPYIAVIRYTKTTD